MSLFEIERLTRENKKLSQTIKQQAKKLTNLQSNSQCQIRQHKENNLLKQREILKSQIKELKRRQEQKDYEREQIESRYLNVLRKLEDEIDESKRKYNRLQSKIEPLVDHDTVRLKILNEVESIHFMEIEEERRKVSSLKDEVLKLKRENELLKHQIQSNKLDYQEEIRQIKMWADHSKNSDHLNQISYEICNDIENRLRLNYEEARKQSEYYKDKYFSSEKKNQQKMMAMERELRALKQMQLLNQR